MELRHLECRPGPFVLEDDRLPGSRSYMAPEEFERGARIDERTMVFRLGRMIDQLTATSRSGKYERIVAACTEPSPDRRLQTVDALWQSWRSLG